MNKNGCWRERGLKKKLFESSPALFLRIFLKITGKMFESNSGKPFSNMNSQYLWPVYVLYSLSFIYDHFFTFPTFPLLCLFLTNFCWRVSSLFGFGVWFFLLDICCKSFSLLSGLCSCLLHTLSLSYFFWIWETRILYNILNKISPIPFHNEIFILFFWCTTGLMTLARYLLFL